MAAPLALLLLDMQDNGQSDKFRNLSGSFGLSSRLDNRVWSLYNLKEFMNVNTLKQIAKFRGLTQSDLARAAKVSRQALSLWFRHPASFVPVASNHLFNLSKSIGTSADLLLNEVSDPGWWERESTNLLWDKAYEDLAEFLAACDRNDPRALARLVEVYGLFASEKILDHRVWDRFPSYKSYLPPIRRSELENLWNTQKNLQLI